MRRAHQLLQQRPAADKLIRRSLPAEAHPSREARSSASPPRTSLTLSETWSAAGPSPSPPARGAVSAVGSGRCRAPSDGGEPCWQCAMGPAVGYCSLQGCPGPPLDQACTREVKQKRAEPGGERRPRPVSALEQPSVGQPRTSSRMQQVEEPEQRTGDGVGGAFSASSLAMLSYGLCILNFDPGPAFAQAVARSLADSCQESGFGPQELFLVLMGLAHWGLKWQQLPEARWQALVLARSAQLLPLSSPDCVAGKLWCLAQLGARPPEGWMRAAESAIMLRTASVDLVEEEESRRHRGQPGSSALSPVGTARCLTALAAMRWVPTPELSRLLVRALCFHSARVPAKHLFPAILATAELGLPVTPEQLRDLVLRPASERKYEHCHTANLVQHARAVLLWRVRPGGRWAALVRNLANRRVDGREGMLARELEQILGEIERF